MPTRRATKIVATLGPASSDPALLEAMIRAGERGAAELQPRQGAGPHRSRCHRARCRPARRAAKWPSWPTCRAPRSAWASLPRAGVLEPGAKFVLDAFAHRARRHRWRGPGLQGAARDVKAGRPAAAQRRPDRAHGGCGARRRGAHHRQAGRRAVQQQGHQQAGGGLTAPAP